MRIYWFSSIFFIVSRFLQNVLVFKGENGNVGVFFKYYGNPVVACVSSLLPPSFLTTLFIQM
jgi:hypothetical protein